MLLILSISRYFHIVQASHNPSTAFRPAAESWRTLLPMPRASPAKTPSPRPTSTTTWIPGEQKAGVNSFPGVL